MGNYPAYYCNYRFAEGDSISVFSGGQFIGRGSFLRIDGPTLIWFDRHGNMNLTDLRVSSIKKVVNCCDGDQGYENGAL